MFPTLTQKGINTIKMVQTEAEINHWRQRRLEDSERAFIDALNFFEVALRKPASPEASVEEQLHLLRLYDTRQEMINQKASRNCLDHMNQEIKLIENHVAKRKQQNLGARNQKKRVNENELLQNSIEKRNKIY